MNFIVKKVLAAPIISPIPDDIFTIIGNLTNLIQPVVILTFLGVLIYGGYIRMTAAGEPEKEARALQIITGAIVGFVIIVIAPILVNIVGQLLNVGTI